MPDADTHTSMSGSTEPRAPLVIAVDGPSGAGKSTLGRKLAGELGLLYLDTGAMYRAVALRISRAGDDPADAAALARHAREAEIELAGEPDRLQVRLDGEEVSAQLRRGEIAQLASIVSANSDVRREMVRRQREIAMRAPAGVVLDGRDIGTIVFPGAPVKFFLTATPHSRATRRFRQADETQDAASFDDVLRDVEERDLRDSTRADSPLQIAEDAVVIDSTEEGIDDVLARMLTVVRERME